MSTNAAAAPTGSVSADRVFESTNTAVHILYQNVSIAAGQTYTASLHLKKGPGATAPDIIQLTFGSNGFAADQYANVNVSTGEILTSVGGTARLTKTLADGWFRFSYTATATITTSGAGLVIVFTNNNDALGRGPSYAGSNSADVLVWGVQQEVGPFPTNYIPTNATTVTRPALNLTRPTAGTALAALNNWAVRIRFSPIAAGQTSKLMGSYTDANNNFSLDMAPTTLTFIKRLAGVDHTAQASLTHAADTLYEAFIYQHSIYGMGISTRSWNGSVWSALSEYVTLTDVDGIADAAIATLYQIGALNNANHSAVNIPFEEIIQLNPALNPQDQLASLLAAGRI
jgi:hypothetical protein